MLACSIKATFVVGSRYSPKPSATWDSGHRADVSTARFKEVLMMITPVLRVIDLCGASVSYVTGIKWILSRKYLAIHAVET